MNKSLYLVPAFLFVTGSTAFAQSPNEVRIDSISYAGSGCPAGSVAENLSDDYRAFTLLFDSYFAELGPLVPRSDNRKNCRINVDLSFPQGWSFSIVELDYRGYVSLDRNVSAVQQSDYYFQGQRGSARLTSSFYGPEDRDYEFRDTLGVTASVWSPCGANRALNISTQVRLASRDRRASGLITLDSIDGQVTHIYGLRWRRC